MILDRFLGNRPSGFYVDVGAHHPKRFSNTFRLYRRGWSGLNIDANPGSMRSFRRVRPRDINIEAAVSSVRQRLTFYIFNDPALNTFSADLAFQHDGGIFSIIKRVEIQTVPLWQMLDEHVPAGTKIDLLTIDVEGLDFDVLKSNDWSHYSPEFILVECWDFSTLEQANADPVVTFLSHFHYSAVAKTMATVLFRHMVPVRGEGTNESAGTPLSTATP